MLVRTPEQESTRVPTPSLIVAFCVARIHVSKSTNDPVLFRETGSPTNIAPRLLGPSNPSPLREPEDGRSSEACLDFHNGKHLGSRGRRVRRAGSTRSCLIHRPHVPRTIDALPCYRRRAADWRLSRPFAWAVARDCRHRRIPF